MEDGEEDADGSATLGKELGVDAAVTGPVSQAMAELDCKVPHGANGQAAASSPARGNQSRQGQMQPCETRRDWLLAAHAAMVAKVPFLSDLACGWTLNSDIATSEHGLAPGRSNRAILYLEGLEVVMRACIRLTLQEATTVELSAAVQKLDDAAVTDPFAGSEGGWVNRATTLVPHQPGFLPMPSRPEELVRSRPELFIPERQAAGEGGNEQLAPALFPKEAQVQAATLLRNDPAAIREGVTLVALAAVLAALGRPAHYFHNR